MIGSSARPFGHWLLQVAIAIACILGLWAPWDHYFGALATTLTWLYIPGLLVRGFHLSFSSATVIVTVTIFGSALAGALLKLSVAADALKVDDTASSEFSNLRQLRLTSVGTMLVSVGVAILMPPSGAAFFLIFLSIVQLSSYFRARKSAAVSSPGPNDSLIVPARRNAAARWGLAMLLESFPAFWAVSLLIFAWRYNPTILLRCLLISLGFSLVARALLPADRRRGLAAGSFSTK